MRERNEINESWSQFSGNDKALPYILEVLLDIRDILTPEELETFPENTGTYQSTNKESK